MTAYFYSASTNGFYTPDINPTMPTDVVEITEEYYQSLLQGQSEGKVIAASAQGQPVLNDPVTIPPTYSELRAAAYPPIVDQLDTIFHGGLDAWKAEIQVTKNKYPKEVA